MAMGAGWRLSPETSYRPSADQQNGLRAGGYVLQLETIGGFQAPAPQAVSVTGGQLREITFTYAETISPLDAWREANFGRGADPRLSADNADPDGDGTANLDEYAAGTGPNNAADFFRVLTATKTATAYTLTAAGKKGRGYVMERSSVPGADGWAAVGGVGPLAVDGPVELTDPAPPPQTGFYRLRVTAP